jgi:hypothetical protein
MSDENLLDYRPEQSDDRAIGGRNDPWRAARSHPLRYRVERFKDRIAPDGYGNDSLASTLHIAFLTGLGIGLGQDQVEG